MEAVNHIQLSIPRALAPVTLRALIYAILFQRNMEAVEPQTFDALDAAVVCAPNESIEKEIRSKLDEFGREYLEPRAIKGELAVVFLQKRPRKGWFATTEELVPWELHLITLNFTCPTPSTDRYGAPAVRQPTSTPSLVPALTQILMFCADKRHAVPPLGGADSGPLHQIMVNPPPASDLFSPSPPLPARSPPPVTTTTLATATLQARDTAHVPSSRSSAANELREARGERSERDRGERGDRDRDRSDRADRADRRGGSTAPSAGSAAVGTGTGTGYSNPLRGYGYSATSASAAGQGQGQGNPYGQQTQGPDGHPQYQHQHQHDGQGQGGYLDAAKDGLRAVRAGAGAVAHWAGRGR